MAADIIPGPQQGHRALPRPALHADHQGRVPRYVRLLQEVPEPRLSQFVLDTLQQQLGDTRAAQSAGLQIRMFSLLDRYKPSFLRIEIFHGIMDIFDTHTNQN